MKLSLVSLLTVALVSTFTVAASADTIVMPEVTIVGKVPTKRHVVCSVRELTQGHGTVRVCHWSK